MATASNSRVLRTIPLLIAVCLAGPPVRAQYGGGTGEPNDPYLIYTAEQMNAIGAEPNEWDKHFKLMADIDLSTYGGTAFNIIGRYVRDTSSGYKPFSGVFDGNGRTISNFNYSGVAAGVGIFGAVEGGQIRHVHLADPNIDGQGQSNSIASLVGWLEDATVSNCSVDGGSVLGGSGVGGIGGLIGKSVYGSIIRDCSVSGFVSGVSEVGGLVGDNSGTITGCHFTGEVSATGTQVGGLVGYNYKSTIADCTVSARVSGTKQAGGLVGAQRSGMITGCHAAGSVAGTDEVGGFIGGNNGTIANCCAISDVTGQTYVGGFAGQNGLNLPSGSGRFALYTVIYGGRISDCYARGGVVGEGSVGGLVGCNDSFGTINNCYATGGVSGTTEVGGLIGQNSLGDVTNSFWDTDTSGQIISAGGTGKTTAQMQDPNTYMSSGWDFAGQPDGPHDIWTVPVEGGYPILLWQLSSSPLLSTFSGGTGEPNDPYLIATAEELNMIGHNPSLMDAHFKLVADIDLANVNFFMIGDYSLPFSGVFDGNGKRIFNLSHIIEETSQSSIDENSVGLFNCVSGGEIKDLGIIDPNIDASRKDWLSPLICWLRGGSVTSCYVQGGSISGSGCVGGLVAKNLNGTIIDCHTATSVEGGHSVGGLVGDNVGDVSDCYSTSSVSGEHTVGGLVGRSSSRRIFNCYSTGNVSASSGSVGGLIGSNGSGGEIIDCYATGSVTGRRIVGGLVGYNKAVSTNSVFAAISNCYATGSIEGVDDVGGLVAYNWAGTISNCYSISRVSGSDNVGGLVGRLGPGEVSRCYSTGKVSGTEDMGGLVGILEGGSVYFSFWDIQTSEQSNSIGGMGITTAEMQLESTYTEAGWDFVGRTANGTDDIWWILEGQDYPRLWWETE